MMENHTAKISIMPQKKLEIASSPPPYQAEPDKLNLAYLYPEGADTEDIINSYAGQVFEELMVMDSEWLADLYELADVSPAVMASRLGKPVHSIKETIIQKMTNISQMIQKPGLFMTGKKFMLILLTETGTLFPGFLM